MLGTAGDVGLASARCRSLRETRSTQSRIASDPDFTPAALQSAAARFVESSSCCSEAQAARRGSRTTAIEWLVRRKLLDVRWTSITPSSMLGTPAISTSVGECAIVHYDRAAHRSTAEVRGK
jgi:hypothetical protein